MKRIIRLSERDLTRIVKRTIHEMDDQDQMEDKSSIASAMNIVGQFLQSNGGGLGSRSNDDIEKDLKSLEHAIKIERNQLGVSNQHSGYKHRSKNDDDNQGDSNDPYLQYMRGGGVSGH
jgi:hypothetical protein